MHHFNRRDFFASAVCAAGIVCRPRNTFGQWHPLTTSTAPLPAATWLDRPMTPASLRELAAQALDAARSAGAHYADVRVAEQVELQIVAGNSASLAWFQLSPFFMYGIRAYVDGAWAFAHGVAPRPDALAESARHAVASAKSTAAFGASSTDLVLPPALTAEWATPIELDPLTVPLGDHAALLSACLEAASRVRNAGIAEPRAWRWMRECRVFASTQGSTLTQLRRTFEPNFPVAAVLPEYLGHVMVLSPVQPMSGGYERVSRPGLQEAIKQQAETAAHYLSLPRRTLDVGRYPIVMSGATVGTVFTRTLGSALEADRVLGTETGADGDSYLSPPSAVMGTLIASPLVTATADRSIPSITAVKWDDEGVEAAEVPLITQGRLTNFITSCQTAHAIRPPGAATGLLARPSAGCAATYNADQPVLVRTPHTTLTHDGGGGTVDELCRDIRHGVLLAYGRSVAAGQRFASGLVFRAGAMLEIENGKIVRRVEGNGLQFTTARLWQSLAALGNSASVESGAIRVYKGQPETGVWTSFSAPAGLFKDVDVVSTKGQL